MWNHYKGVIKLSQKFYKHGYHLEKSNKSSSVGAILVLERCYTGLLSGCYEFVIKNVIGVV